MSDINEKYRPELKSYFLAYSLPPQQNFENLIDAMIIQGEDPIAIPPDSPLQVRVVGNNEGRNEFIRFGEDFNDPDPWILGQNPTTKNLEFATTTASRLSIDKSNGLLGVNTPAPQTQLEVSIDNDDIDIPPLMIGGTDTNYLSISSQNENARTVIGGDIPGDYTAKAKLHITLNSEGEQNGVNPLVIEGQQDNEYFFINSKGQVGINTDISTLGDPEKVKLRVNGDIKAGTSNNFIYLQNAGNDSTPTLFATGNRLKIVSSGDIALWASGDPANAIDDSTVFYLSEEGKVSIGKKSPETKLEVVGDIKVGSSTCPIYLKNATSGGAPTLLSPATDKGLKVMAGKDIAFWANNTNEDSPGTSHLFIQANGKIGIGTDSPGSKITVNGSVQAGIGDVIHLKNTSGGDPVLFSPSEGKPLKVVAGQDIAFWAGNPDDESLGTSHMVIKNDGNIGIGTDNPTEKLEVHGNAKADSFTGDIDASCIVAGLIDSILLFPLRTIIMWYGDQESVPNGWEVCDGSTHGEITTPDLQGLFIVGASTSSSGDYSLGNTGGEPEYTLTKEEIPTHDHDVIDLGHTHSYQKVGERHGDDEDKDGHLSKYNSSAQTGIGYANNIVIGNTGGDQPHENRPPFVAVYFIMKVLE